MILCDESQLLCEHRECVPAAGWRDFVWVSGYVLLFWRSLFSDCSAAACVGSNIDNGMPKAVWNAIRSSYTGAPTVAR